MARFINERNSDADKQLTLRFPKGVDQVSPETSLLPGTARRIVNLDVHQGMVGENGPIGGRLSARSQVRQVVAGTRTHSLWAGDHNTCFVDAGDLKRLGPDMTATLLRAGVGDDEMFYTEIAGVVYYSNGRVTGTVTNGVDAPWGLPVPPAPSVAAVSSGGLAVGTYMVTLTYKDASGRESGASPTSVVQVEAGGGIALSGMAAAYVTRVYVTPPNGEALYWAHDLPSGATVSYVGAHQPGKMLSTQHMQPPEPCTHLESYNGRIYSAVGNAVLATQALNYDLTRPATDYVLMPDAVTMVKAVSGGLYVGSAHGVTFLEGKELGQFSAGMADMLAPVPGSALNVDGGLFGEPGTGVVWLTRRGWVYAGAGGRVKRLTESQMAIPEYDRAASLYREHDGMRQVMTFVKGGGEAAGASDSYDVEIVRNGRVI
jgi:hypothetical protein